MPQIMKNGLIETTPVSNPDTAFFRELNSLVTNFTQGLKTARDLKESIRPENTPNKSQAQTSGGSRSFGIGEFLDIACSTGQGGKTLGELLDELKPRKLSEIRELLRYVQTQINK